MTAYAGDTTNPDHGKPRIAQNRADRPKNQPKFDPYPVSSPLKRDFPYNPSTLDSVLAVSPSGYRGCAVRHANPGGVRRARGGVWQSASDERITPGWGRLWATSGRAADAAGRPAGPAAAALPSVHGRQRSCVADRAERLLYYPPLTAADQLWVADPTYVETAAGWLWLYLAGVMDLFSRRIVGWATSRHLATSLVLQALQSALMARRPRPGLIVHSDRGAQYASVAYRTALQAHGLVASMNRRANCYDNAAMESFWSSLKIEKLHRHRFNNATEGSGLQLL